MRTPESFENYLETIYILLKEGNVRSVDVARELGYAKASISRAVGKMKESGHISVDEHGSITLTEEGARLAGEIYDRHVSIERFLESIGVSAETAENDSCRIEHIISDETFARIKEYLGSKETK